MPCVIRVPVNSSSPRWVEPELTQPIYDTTDIAYLDVQKTDLQENIQQPIEEENVSEVAYEDDYEVNREVPYYADEEALPDEECFEDQPDFDMPDMVTEVHDYVPLCRAKPPPPPVHVTTREPMLFWYRRVLASPVYNACVHLVRMSCPAIDDNADDHSYELWVSQCAQWWENLDTVVQQHGTPDRIPVFRTWNPYSMESSHTIRGVYAPKNVVVDETAARYPVPPPPSYATVVGEYGRYMKLVDAEAAYKQHLCLWWRKACEWTVAAMPLFTWASPPPTTGTNARNWGDRCKQWWSFTLSELKSVDKERKPKASKRPTHSSLKVLMAPAPDPTPIEVDPQELKNLW